MNLAKDLEKAQKQLGALVYTLAKTGEKNDDLVAQYVDDIHRAGATVAQKRLHERSARHPEPASLARAHTYHVASCRRKVVLQARHADGGQDDVPRPGRG